jgi:transcriptional regulator GlxA family with amidase domain
MYDRLMRFSLLTYPGVEPIDLATIGVVSMGRRVIPDLSYELLALSREPVELANGLLVLPTRSVDEVDVATLDVVVVPGGPGWRAASQDARWLAFIRSARGHATLASACTGAMILGAAGVLDGRRATTKCEVVAPEVPPLDELRDAYPAIRASKALLVDEGDVVTGGGVTLCIDLVLHLIERRYGAVAGDEVARILEYTAARASNRSRLPAFATSAMDAARS